MSTELTNIKLIKKIASGAFGEIYLGHDSNLQVPVAVKIEKRETHAQIKHEYSVYRRLSKTQSRFSMGIKSDLIPKIFSYGKININNILTNCLVMELLGKSLEEIFVENNRRFKLQTVVSLGIRMLESVELVHNKHFVHRDIKPDNFVFDISQSTLYLIDYGLAKEYRDPNTLVHREIRYDKSLTGTARYASIRTHQGIEQSRRDDLESIGYCLIYFLKGRLPWQGLRAETKQDRYDKIKEYKENMKIWELCSDLPHEFYMYIFYVRNLGYDDWPNYEYLRDLFRGINKKNQFRDQINFSNL
ncbi:casein kinase I [Vairimorpha necatrix]|uniref:non-specific serine/threonine protein kinase n=1 Tax=Vairimorpha necatrix TaxID=6039 RepID=A0AAX4JFY1_9MICR